MATEVNQALAAHAQALLDEAAGRGQRAIDQVAAELEQFARLLVHQVRLRKALADPGLPPEPKRALLTELGGGRLDQTTVELLATAATRQRVRLRDFPAAAGRPRRHGRHHRRRQGRPAGAARGRAVLRRHPGRAAAAGALGPDQPRPARREQAGAGRRPARRPGRRPHRRPGRPGGRAVRGPRPGHPGQAVGRGGGGPPQPGGGRGPQRRRARHPSARPGWPRP